MLECTACGKAHNNHERAQCYRCRMDARPARECPRCGRLHKRDTAACLTCLRSRRCQACYGPLTGGRKTVCVGCAVARAALVEFPAVRPPFGWPEGHFEELAARAERELPLFG